MNSLNHRVNSLQRDQSTYTMNSNAPRRNTANIGETTRMAPSIGEYRSNAQLNNQSVNYQYGNYSISVPAYSSTIEPRAYPPPSYGGHNSNYLNSGTDIYSGISTVSTQSSPYLPQKPMAAPFVPFKALYTSSSNAVAPKQTNSLTNQSHINPRNQELRDQLMETKLTKEIGSNIGEKSSNEKSEKINQRELSQLRRANTMLVSELKCAQNQLAAARKQLTGEKLIDSIYSEFVNLGNPRNQNHWKQRQGDQIKIQIAPPSDRCEPKEGEFVKQLVSRIEREKQKLQSESQRQPPQRQCNNKSKRTHYHRRIRSTKPSPQQLQQEEFRLIAGSRLKSYLQKKRKRQKRQKAWYDTSSQSEDDMLVQGLDNFSPGPCNGEEPDCPPPDCSPTERFSVHSPTSPTVQSVFEQETEQWNKMLGSLRSPKQAECKDSEHELKRQKMFKKTKQARHLETTVAEEITKLRRMIKGDFVVK